MNKKVFAFALLAAFCLGGCKPDATDQDVIVTGEELPVQYINVDWSYRYEDLDEMAADSDLIALIQVDSLSDQSSGSTSIFDVTVTEAVYGCEDQETIQVTMQGGRAKYAIRIVPTDPLMEPGQKFMIFAQKNEDGTYSILNGEEGRFLYEDGLLTALQYTDLPEKPGSGFEIKDKPFDEVVQQLQSVLSE